MWCACRLRYDVQPGTTDALEPALHGGEHGAEQLRDLGSGGEDEVFALFFEECDGTHLETRGVGVRIDLVRLRLERWRRELSRGECALDVVAEAAHGHALRAFDPALAMTRGRGLEQERNEHVRMHPGDPTTGERLAQRGTDPRGALDPQQRSRAARRQA